MLRPIKTKKQYAAALEQAYTLMQKDLRQDSESSDTLEVLSILIEHYEAKAYPIAPAQPIEAIRFRMEQLGMTATDLREIFGYRSRVSEVLNGKRKLTLEMIRNLHEQLHIPLESLVSRY